MSAPSAPAETAAFNEADQMQLDADKRKIRLENEKYLRSHPELSQIISVVMTEILREQPSDPVSFVARYMTDPDLKSKVVKAVKTIGIS